MSAARGRGEHEEFVFGFRRRRLAAIDNTGGHKARQWTGLPHVRVRDLEHIFGRRLGATGMSFENRQDLLGYKAGRITPRRSSRTSWKPRRASAGRGPARLPHWRSCGARSAPGYKSAIT
jgi:hypothetical protein